MLQTDCPTYIISATSICYDHDRTHQRLANSSSSSNTKGNDGSSPYQRQRRICRMIVWTLAALGAYQLLVAHFLAGIVPDIEIDQVTGQKRVRRHPERVKKLDAKGNVVPRYVLSVVSCVCMYCTALLVNLT